MDAPHPVAGRGVPEQIAGQPIVQTERNIIAGIYSARSRGKANKQPDERAS